MKRILFFSVVIFSIGACTNPDSTGYRSNDTKPEDLHSNHSVPTGTGATGLDSSRRGTMNGTGQRGGTNANAGGTSSTMSGAPDSTGH